MIISNTTKVSIIVPIYQSEQYLSQCIDSIISQTFKDFELILIDDGSTDKSGIICDEYQKLDSRVKVLHIQNQGVSNARNIGINTAKGEWITFVDSDDWLEATYLAAFFELNLQEDTLYVEQAQAVKSSLYKYWPAKFPSTILTLNSINDYTSLNNILIYGTPWGKLYNTNVIKKNKIFFDRQISLHEDHCFYFEYIRHIKHINIINKSRYYYRIILNSQSLSSNKKMPAYDKLLYAHNCLNRLMHAIILENKLQSDKLRPTLHFITAIKIKGLRAAFINIIPPKTRYSIIKTINETDLNNYQPVSKGGKLLKIILRFKNIHLKYILLTLLKKKLK